MTEFLGFISMFLAVLGVLKNNRRLVSCFYIWIASNGISAWMHYHAGIYSLMIRDLVFILLSIEGIMLWKNADEKKSVKES